MSDDITNFIIEFSKISKKKWIKSVTKSFGSVGLTFEKELNKKPDSLFFPDYYGIEIKCTSRYSRYPLYLFTLAFDGPTFPEIERIVNKYGIRDKDFLNKKVLFAKLSVIEKTIVNEKYKFQLEVNDKDERIYLLVYDLDDNLIEKKSFVYIENIKNHLLVKLRKIALVYASKKKENNEIYFRYYKTEIYELSNFEKFIELLEKGYINVDLISRISKSGEDKGRYRNKNLVFSINKKYIKLLFKKVYEYNYDIVN